MNKIHSEKSKLTFSRKYEKMILTGEKMIKDTLALMHSLKGFASPKSKLTRMVKAGEWIQIRRGLYISEDDKTSPHLLAPMIYGPSYLSFEFALSYHGLIPERPQSFLSATYAKNKQKVFRTCFGDYYYWNIPALAYPKGILLEKEIGFPFLIASPEKALCDSVYKLHRKGKKINIQSLLLEDWRIEWESLKGLNQELISLLAPMYHKRIVIDLSNWIKNEVTHA